MKTIITRILLFLAVLTAGSSLSSARDLQTPCAGRVVRHNLYSPQLKTTVTVDVWLPSDYDVQATNTYPVIYANDGQNMFDPNGSFAGVAWDVDDAIESLHADGITEAAVVVGVHCTGNRFGDYAPSKAVRAAGLESSMCAAWGGVSLRGDEYLDFIVNTLKPVIDRDYRVRTDLQSTTVLGSSMGGLISCYAMCEYPDVFGNALCLSTHWSGALDNSTPLFGQAVIEYMKQNLPADGRHRLYLDHGTKGLDAAYRACNDKAIALAAEKGYEEGYDLMTYIDEGADHNEVAWRGRVEKPLRFALSAMLPRQMDDAYKLGLPGRIGDGVILHCFQWKLTDIIDELPAIAKAGFKAIQTSPMQRNVRVGDVWYDVYRPYDYRFIDNGLGSRDDMRRLCAEASRYGIDVIVDVVANHGTCTYEEYDPWWNDNGRMAWGKTISWGNRWSETHEALGEYGESNSDDPDVQARTRNYILELKGLGVKGLRWDAAKHIALPSEGCDFWKNVLTVPGIWSYGEILGTPAEHPELLKEYARYMSFTNPGGSASNTNTYEWLGIPMSSQVLWVESHDTFSNDTGGSQTIAQDEIDRRWALTAAREGATALYFSRPNFGGKDNILVGTKGAVDFSAPEVAAANHFHNVMAGMPETMLWLEDGVAAVYRVKGVVITRSGGAGPVEIPMGNLDPDGVYEDEVSGKKFSVSNGKLCGHIASEIGVAVLYDYKGESVSDPRVEMTPLVEAFSKSTCEITLRAFNCSSASYSVDGSVPVEFRGYTSFMIGDGVEPGSDVVIDWTATNAGKTVAGSFVVSKLLPPPPCHVYMRYDDPALDSATFYTFVYNSAGASVAGWPGQTMTRDNSLTINGRSGCWLSYRVPDGFADDGFAMVSSSGSVRYPADNVPGIPLEGKSLVFEYVKGKWTVGRVTDYGGVDNILVSDDEMAYAVEGGIVAGNVPADVYNLSGQFVGRVEADAFRAFASGLYIVRAGACAGKIAVR